MTTTRRALLRSLLAAGLGSAGGVVPGAASLSCSFAAADRPNFLLIVSDDQGAMMGALGTPGLRTPHMDAMARSGALFAQAFTVCPLCTPSRSALLTGHFPHTSNARVNVCEHFGPAPSFTDAQLARNEENGLPPQIPTLIERLAVAGYRTGITSKFHLPQHRRFPFDAWLSSETAGIRRFLEEPDRRPWLLMVNLRSPHRNFESFQEGPSPDPASIDVPGHLAGGSSATNRADYAAYLRAIQRTDRLVGQALGALADAGVEDRTIVLFLGDHGPPYHRAKHSPYGLGLRIPLCVCGPARYVVRQPEPVGQLTSIIDLMPTILDYAGLPIPGALPGRSLRPILTGRTSVAGHEFVFGEVHHGDVGGSLQERSIFDGRYRLIFRDHLERPVAEPADNTDLERWGNPVVDEIVARRDESEELRLAYRLLDERSSFLQEHRIKRFELYDVAQDPWELDDRYGDPAFAPMALHLALALQRWLLRTDDVYVDPAKLA